MGLITRLRPTPTDPKRFSLEQLVAQVNYLSHSYPLGLQTTMNGGDTEDPDSGFRAVVNTAYRSGGPVFSCVLARAMLFSEARFLYQGFESGRPAGLFSNDSLRILENPWPNGTTREMLWRAEQDVSLAGNFFLRSFRGRLWRLRPDYMTIVLGSMMEVDDPADAIDAEVIGYRWAPPQHGKSGFVLMPEEVVHWSPIPDPLANYRGMSWVTPILREVSTDTSAVAHKGKFFEQGASPNLVVMPDATVSYDEFKEFKDDFQDQHEGAWNAYKTLFLGGGSTVQTVGSSMKDMDYKGLQGISETRIAAAANVPPIVAGFSEGLQAATYSNYGQARRKFGDHFARPQWGSFADAVSMIAPPPSRGSRLWYDDRDIAFLREDQGDEAEIRNKDAATVRTLVEAGFEPDAAVAFVGSGNLAALDGHHSGNVSVQLQPADQVAGLAAGNGTPPQIEAAPDEDDEV